MDDPESTDRPSDPRPDPSDAPGGEPRTSGTGDGFSPSADELVERNRTHAEGFEGSDLQVRPTRKMAIVTCMDSRMDVFALLGLGNGEAHIIRNAGGVITDDVIRSLCLSQRYLGTREIVLVHHTDCGLQMVTEDGLKSELQAEIGIKPWWAVESFDDPHLDVRQSMRRLELTPFVPHKDHVRGFVYDVTTGSLDEVDPAAG
ncbi:beta-class carbonic anhydrase [Ilumatobacter sp.]|uniref:beta-class carbonic anhydrase n=1 Tax=Ilumatobacter sp. TaxID=1967498 RepID=UPI003B52BA22